MNKDVSMYWNPSKTLSKQRLFNFVLGGRGIGKTYGSKMTVIRNFLRKKEQFVYIRRYDTEIPAAEMKNFFDDVAEEFPDHDFKSGMGLFRIDGEIAGWYICLSKATMLKSIPFPNVSVIIFDEFIIEVGLHRYLPNEVRTFLECYSTISRDRDVPVLFLSNALTMTNPYFLYFDISLEEGQTVKLTQFISVEILSSPKFEKHMSQTKFGQLIKGTAYGQYAIENKFLLDTDTFIKPLTTGASYICTFVLNGELVGFYVGDEDSMYYLSDKVDATCPRKFALTNDEHDQNTILAVRTNNYVRCMIDSYCQGILRFTSIKVKNMCLDMIRRFM